MPPKRTLAQILEGLPAKRDAYLSPHALSVVKCIGKTVENFIGFIEKNLESPTLESAAEEDTALNHRYTRFKNKSFPPPLDPKDLIFSLDHLKEPRKQAIAVPPKLDYLMTKVKKMKKEDLDAENIKLRKITFPAGVKYPHAEMEATKVFWKKLAKMKEDGIPLSFDDSREEWARMKIREWHLNESQSNRVARLDVKMVNTKKAKEKGITYTEEQRAAVVATIFKLYHEVMNDDAYSVFGAQAEKKAEAAENLQQRVAGKPATDQELLSQLMYLYSRRRGLNHRLEDPQYHQHAAEYEQRLRIPRVIELAIEMGDWKTDTVPSDPLSEEFLVMDRIYLRAQWHIHKIDHPEAVLKSRRASKARVADLASKDSAVGEKKRARKEAARLVYIPAMKKAKMMHRFGFDNQQKTNSMDSDDEGMFEAGFDEDAGEFKSSKLDERREGERRDLTFSFSFGPQGYFDSDGDEMMQEVGSDSDGDF
ncbi:hypothetical protein BDY24DRAFT_383773 [Mrakia frigida]|uniref:uncharacterized protein n=1 Tax=Mrakia frigida TaxID=29902 RepID=UPI003FCC26CC